MNWLARLGRRGADRPDFSGKVIVIHCGLGESGGALEDARIVEVGFGRFLVGRRVEMEPWLEGRWSWVIAWFNISEIRQMYVFDDLAAARRAYESDGD